MLKRIGTASEQLAELYEQPGHGLKLSRVAGGYQLVTRPEYSPYVEKMLKENQEPPLSQAAMETLTS